MSSSNATILPDQYQLASYRCDLPDIAPADDTNPTNSTNNNNNNNNNNLPDDPQAPLRHHHQQQQRHYHHCHSISKDQPKTLQSIEYYSNQIENHDLYSLLPPSSLHEDLSYIQLHQYPPNYFRSSSAGSFFHPGSSVGILNLSLIGFLHLSSLVMLFVISLSDLGQVIVTATGSSYSKWVVIGGCILISLIYLYHLYYWWMANPGHHQTSSSSITGETAQSITPPSQQQPQEQKPQQQQQPQNNIGGTHSNSNRHDSGQSIANAFTNQPPTTSTAAIGLKGTNQLQSIRGDYQFTPAKQVMTNLDHLAIQLAILDFARPFIFFYLDWTPPRQKSFITDPRLREMQGKLLRLPIIQFKRLGQTPPDEFISKLYQKEFEDYYHVCQIPFKPVFMLSRHQYDEIEKIRYSLLEMVLQNDPFAQVHVIFSVQSLIDPATILAIVYDNMMSKQQQQQQPHSDTTAAATTTITTTTDDRNRNRNRHNPDTNPGNNYRQRRSTLTNSLVGSKSFVSINGGARNNFTNIPATNNDDDDDDDEPLPKLAHNNSSELAHFSLTPTKVKRKRDINTTGQNESSPSSSSQSPLALFANTAFTSRTRTHSESLTRSSSGNNALSYQIFKSSSRNEYMDGIWEDDCDEDEDELLSNSSLSDGADVNGCGEDNDKQQFVLDIKSLQTHDELQAKQLLPQTSSGKSFGYHPPTIFTAKSPKRRQIEELAAFRRELGRFFFTAQAYKPLEPISTHPTSSQTTLARLSGLTRTTGGRIRNRLTGGGLARGTGTNHDNNSNDEAERAAIADVIPSYTNHLSVKLTPPPLKQDRALFYQPCHEQTTTTTPSSSSWLYIWHHFLLHLSFPFACLGLPYLYYYISNLIYPVIAYEMPFYVQICDLGLWHMLWRENSPALDPNYSPIDSKVGVGDGVGSNNNNHNNGVSSSFDHSHDASSIYSNGAGGGYRDSHGKLLDTLSLVLSGGESVSSKTTTATSQQGEFHQLYLDLIDNIQSNQLNKII